MKNWTIHQRILGIFAGLMVITAVMCAVTYYFFQEIDENAKTISLDSTPGSIISAQIETGMLENYARVQRILLLDDDDEKHKINAAIVAARERYLVRMNKYEATITQASERQLFETFKEAIPPYWAMQDRLMKAGTELDGKKLQAVLDDEVDPAFKKARTALAALVDRNEKYTSASIDEINGSIDSASSAILAGMVTIFVLCLFSGYFLLSAITAPLQQLVNALDVMRQGDFTNRINAERRDEFGQVSDGFNRMSDELAALVGQVQKSGLQVSTSVTEIAATSKQQQATATEIAATTAEIGATSKEISATSKQLVKTINDVSMVAEQSASLASSGQTGLAHMGETMRHVMEATKSINTKLVVLNEKAGNINQVITTISKVAEQTNLLSLNAAIEAVKAGEHGRGFSVVATEIRRLADQTAVATFDIGQTVKEIQGAVSSSVMGMDKFSDEVRKGMEEIQQISGQLSQIIQQVQTLAPRVEDVNEGMQAQASGAEQITQALAQLNESAQQTVDSLRQSSIAIDDLNQVANGLRGGVSRFKLRS